MADQTCTVAYRGFFIIVFSTLRTFQRNSNSNKQSEVRRQTEKFSIWLEVLRPF